MRASSVVKRQFTRTASRLRHSCHAPTSRRRTPLSGMRRSKHCRAITLSFYLRYVQPTPVFGSVVYFQPLSDTPRLGGLERLVQSGQPVRVEVVHHQHDPISFSAVFIDQSLYHMRPVHFRATLSDLYPTPSSQRREQHEQATHPVALVFAYVDTAPDPAGRGARVSLNCCLLVSSIHTSTSFPSYGRW